MESLRYTHIYIERNREQVRSRSLSRLSIELRRSYELKTLYSHWDSLCSTEYWYIIAADDYYFMNVPVPAMYMYYIISSEASSLLGLESFCMASVGVCFACVKFSFLTLFGNSGHVAKCFWVISCGISQGGHTRPTNSTVLCLPGK